MRLTRQAWGCYLLVVALTALGVIFAKPVLFAGSAMVGVWILTRQYLFVRELDSIVGLITVTQSPSKTTTRTETSTTVTLTAALEESPPFQLELTSGTPPSAVIDQPLTLTIDAGTTQETQTSAVTWPVAGTHQFQAPQLTASDGLFTETLSIGTTPTVTVEPPTPRNVHVGAGGTRVPLVQGEHDTGRTGSGIEPAEVREYTPGDTAAQIDWKATARLATPHVRTYEAETDRPTVIVVDQRDHLSMGPTGETKLDYLREIGLTIATSAQQLGDPIGFLGVGNGGITTRIRPTTGTEAYTTIRRKLLEIEPSNHDTRASQGISASGTGEFSTQEMKQQAGLPTNPTSALTHLDDDEQFTQQLRPFYEKQTVYSTRIQADPFSTAIESLVSERGRGAFVVLCTDNSNPGELRRAVRIARANDSTVLVLLTPTVLFEAGGLSDAEAAYETYRSFERLRNDLDQLAGVSALEIAPGDRLAAVLAAGEQ